MFSNNIRKKLLCIIGGDKMVNEQSCQRDVSNKSGLQSESKVEGPS